MSRTKRLRSQLDWSQARIAEFLGVTQGNIARIEGGASESGAIGRLLDQLEAGVASGAFRAGMTPEQVVAAIRAAAASPFPTEAEA
ncbi:MULTISPECIES: helix-turn-helix domain-containing protein [Methylosinus]|uniref:XRE family transcriptional regulator n=1 Tax=Methylosinus trichosporium (strain ATCC 35070 / NCIMB 11131 / UNIQEM 75 / OB3b) TaxID=595536 RepID=A0A2D2CYE4_METT3|nr:MULTISPECIES: helix-turn-helix domain-containing protein [Methylosinus]ATQ67758.1 XRE family transcriptional regulator [Methylosinus trichosporium OB3b]OBS51135.1 hypothetical protein A8B73_17585 [Methylosinus sp. 3S-1]